MKNNQSDIRQTHRASILKSLEYRLATAKNQGNADLVAQLEAEKRYYAG